MSLRARGILTVPLLATLLFGGGCDLLQDVLETPLLGDPLWTYTLQDSERHLTSGPLAVGSESVYFAAGGNMSNGTDFAAQRVFALDRETGDLRWQSPDLETWHTQGPIVVGDDGTLYVASGYTLYALDPADGTVRWTWTPPETLPDANGNDVSTYGELGPLALTNDGDLLAVTSGDGSYARAIYRIDNSGATVWHRFTYSTTAGTPMVVGEDGTIFKIDFFDGDASYSVTAIRPETGELAWKVPTKVSEASNSVTFAPDGDIVFLRDYDALVRVDASSQETLWSAQVASQNARTSDPDGNLYLFDAHAGCTLVALDDGQIVASGVAVPQRPVVDEMGRLYGILSDWHPHLTLTDKEGTVVWENDVDFDGNSLALSNDGSIYFMSGESIHAVASDAGLAHAGWPRVTHDARNTRNATKW